MRKKLPGKQKLALLERRSYYLQQIAQIDHLLGEDSFDDVVTESENFDEEVL